MSLWVKKFIKKIEYCRDEIAVTAYYMESPGEEIITNDASGWVRAATGKDHNSDYDKETPTGTGRNNSSECIEWLLSSASLQTIEIVLPNIIHGCKRKKLRHL